MRYDIFYIFPQPYSAVHLFQVLTGFFATEPVAAVVPFPIRLFYRLSNGGKL